MESVSPDASLLTQIAPEMQAIITQCLRSDESFPRTTVAMLIPLLTERLNDVVNYFPQDALPLADLRGVVEHLLAVAYQLSMHADAMAEQHCPSLRNGSMLEADARE